MDLSEGVVVNSISGLGSAVFRHTPHTLWSLVSRHSSRNFCELGADHASDS